MASTSGRGIDLPGVHPSSNLHDHPDVYEVENRAADPERRIEAAMRTVQPWDGRVVLDLGAGAGFHVERFAADAAHVIAVEPHDAARLAAMERVVRLGLRNVSVMTGSAEHLLLADTSVDVVHARFAYFFGPGSEAGIAEVERVLRPGGVFFVVDNDRAHGPFASWLARSSWAPPASAEQVEDYWRRAGFTLVRVPSEWRFERRADLEAVLGIEFPPDMAATLAAEHQGTSVDCHYALYWRRRG